MMNELFPFQLDTFQKEAIRAIENKQHVLVTAHTGSGKTVPAEFAIHHFCSTNNQRVIYTSPIKSLSNQKFHELSQRFPYISFGICTGDIKYNPDADCVVMTTEILRNMLYQKNNTSNIGCVIFDEVHYINDVHRGKVWEECIMMLPKFINMVMLSATIEHPELFTSWISEIKKIPVILTGTTKRVVPLTHYSFLSMSEANKKNIPIQLHKYSNIMLPIKLPNQPYQEKYIDKIQKVYKEMDKQRVYIKPSFALNHIIETLREKEMLPAICFVFSRKKAEEYANLIEHNLHDDPKKISNVHKECESILRNTLSNYKEYTTSNEYVYMMKLLEKGIAVHHSGIIPIIREMIELLFSRGYIKLLFATETFSVGINMPTKTVLFTSITKWDGFQQRILLAHEYTQMAGRAGRRGLDTIGHVIHLHALFEPPCHADYNIMLSGKSQTIQSRLDIDFNYVLRILFNQQTLESNIRSSMMFRKILKEIHTLNEELQKHRKEQLLEDHNYPHKALKEYIELEELLSSGFLKHVQRKQYKKKYDELAKEIGSEEYIVRYKEHKNRKNQIKRVETNIIAQEQYIDNISSIIFSVLEEYGYIKQERKLTTKGIIAASIQECNSFIMSECIVNRYIHQLDTHELILFLSCFVNIRVPEGQEIMSYTGEYKSLAHCLEYVEDIHQKYYQMELRKIGYIQEDEYFYQYDLIQAVDMWIQANTEQETKRVLTYLEDYNIFPGEFVKAILKINAMALELENVCDMINDISLKEKLHVIPRKTLKYIATNQSLYL